MKFIHSIHAVVAFSAVSLVGCAALLGVHKSASHAERVAGPVNCFRSYLSGAQRRSNPGATAAVATWYVGLTPQIVEGFAADATRDQFGTRAMAHAIAAGVPEGDFLRGEHPDPEPACGVFWNHEDVGDYRFDNAASAAWSVIRRDAFATCAKEFDELAPKLGALAQQTKRELAAFPPDANPYLVWSAYHRAMAAQRELVPAKGPDGVPLYAYAGAPYVAFTDMVMRFARTPLSFLNYHFLGGVSPFPDNAQRFILPLDTPTENDKLMYCATKLRDLGQLYTDFTHEQIKKIFARFDGQAWLDAQPAPGEKYSTGTIHLSEQDLRPGHAMDRAMGGRGDGPESEKFRLYQRTVTSTALKDGRGTVDLINIENLHITYDCKEVVKIKREKDQSATFTRDDVCKIDDTVVTDKLQLGVDGLPPGVALNVGDELVFFAERTSKDYRDGSKPTAKGRASFRTTTAAARLLFVAQIRRGATIVYPAAK